MSIDKENSQLSRSPSKLRLALAAILAIGLGLGTRTCTNTEPRAKTQPIGNNTANSNQLHHTNVWSGRDDTFIHPAPLNPAPHQTHSGFSNSLELDRDHLEKRGEAIVLDIEAERLETPPLSLAECTAEVNRRADRDYGVNLNDGNEANALYIGSDQAFESLGTEVSRGSHPENGILWAACSENLSIAMQLAYRHNQAELASRIFFTRLADLETLPDSDEKSEWLDELFGNTFAEYPELVGSIIDNLNDDKKVRIKAALQQAITMNRASISIDHHIIEFTERYGVSHASSTRNIVDCEAKIRRLEMVYRLYFPQ